MLPSMGEPRLRSCRPRGPNALTPVNDYTPVRPPIPLRKVPYGHAIRFGDDVKTTIYRVRSTFR